MFKERIIKNTNKITQKVFHHPDLLCTNRIDSVNASPTDAFLSNIKYGT